MTLDEVLNLDVGAVGEELGRGFRWWTGELADLTPARWRRGRNGARPVAELCADGSILLWRRGKDVEVVEGVADRARAADVGVSPDLVLERELTLPALRLDDLRRLVGNDLDRLTPFRSDQVYFDLALPAEGAGADRIVARLALIRREDAERAVERAERLGFSLRRLGVSAADGALSFDFLPALRAAGRGGRSDRTPLFWWSAVAIGVALNVGVMVFKDSYDVASLKNLTDLQQPSVDLAFKLRQRLENETGARQALLARRDRNEPLRILDVATRVLPAPQSLQRLEWNGHAVRLVGFRDPRFDVLAALQSSKLMTRPRQASAGEAATPGAQPAFDVVADLAAGGGR